MNLQKGINRKKKGEESLCGLGPNHTSHSASPRSPLSPCAPLRSHRAHGSLAGGTRWSAPPNPRRARCSGNDMWACLAGVLQIHCDRHMSGPGVGFTFFATNAARKIVIGHKSHRPLLQLTTPYSALVHIKPKPPRPQFPSDHSAIGSASTTGKREERASLAPFGFD